MQVSRRTFIGASAAGMALAATGGANMFAQDGDKPTVSIGSKNFTESIVLGEMVAVLLEDQGYEVERNLNLGGTLVAHEALVNGDIDTYVEYTGTGLMAILGKDLPEGTARAAATPASSSATQSLPEKVYDIVADEYPKQFDVEWLEPWGFNNTNALVMTRESADELGVKTISDLRPYAADMTLGSDQEFRVRPDGLPGLEKTYDFEFGDVMSGDIGLMYSAVSEGDVDIIQGYSTDGRIQSLDLVILEDDQGFFPPYFAAPVVRQALLQDAPEVENILNQLAWNITDSTMASINARVDEDGLEPIDAAREYLEDQGLIHS